MRLVPRSAAARIATISAGAFALSVLVVGLVLLLAVQRAFEHQLDHAIEQATTSLAGEFEEDGLTGVQEDIAIREKGPASGLAFAVFSPGGERVTGQLDTVMLRPGWQRIAFRSNDGAHDPARALATRLPDGSLLVVAADLEPLEAMAETILAIFALGLAGLVALSVAFAIVLRRYLKRRLDAIAVGSQAFANGNYGGRAQVGRRGDEFDQLAISLNAMLDRIEALLTNLRQVTSGLAHDLRTPLTRLRSRLEDLREAPVDEREERIEAAIERSDEILQLFAAILRISELEGGETRRHFRPLDLAALVEEIVEAHHPLAEESGHRLTARIDPATEKLTGDRDLLAQAAINLLQNALIHTPRGTHVVMGLTSDNGHACLFVRDDGPGIAPDDRERATRRFVRLDAARSTLGHGLGLSLVKAIAEAHGAMLELRDAKPGLEVRIVFAGGGK